jgi:hypothetical protein
MIGFSQAGFWRRQHLSAFWEARDTAQHLLDELTSLCPEDLSVATLSLGYMMPRCFLVRS